jgi:putative ABC transport system permease protein
MNIWQAVIEALESILSNKLRSSLTILGIVIGVAAVIAMLAVGTGAQETITGEISGIGVNLIFIFSGNDQEDVRNIEPLTIGDADALRDQFLAPSVQVVAPIIGSRKEVAWGGRSTNADVNGITPDYLFARNYELIEGEFITEEHLLGQASVALIGPDVADSLFERQEGITGDTIRIEGQPFRVLGILASKGGGSFGSEDNVILLPITTARSRLMRRAMDRVDIILVQATDAETVDSATDEITQILRDRHRIRLGPNDFTVVTQEAFVESVQSILGVFTIFLGGIAGISLLVGGIGIMNIMLVSVTERTREIGLRKALGARKRDILFQFLTESSLLSLIGGVIGIGLGWLLAYIVGRIAEASGTPFNPLVGLDAVLLATLFSAAVGLFFGIYPANRAANLVPVEALRYE